MENENIQPDNPSNAPVEETPAAQPQPEAAAPPRRQSRRLRRRHSRTI